MNIKTCFVVAALFLGAAAPLRVAAQSIMVDVAGVADAIARNALVWDVRPADAFAKGHIDRKSVV